MNDHNTENPQPLKQQLMDLGVEETSADKALALGGDRVKGWLKKLLPVIISIIAEELSKSE